MKRLQLKAYSRVIGNSTIHVAEITNTLNDGDVYTFLKFGSVDKIATDKWIKEQKEKYNL